VKRYIPILFTLIAGLFLFLGCELKNPFEQKLPNQSLGNIPPETHLFLPDSIQSTQDSTVLQIDTVITGEDTVVDSTYIPLAITGSHNRFIPDTTESKKILHWWGDDEDGEVIGYYYKWNFQSGWTFTTAEWDTFYLPIRSAYDEFEFQVKAVDNDSTLDPTPSRITFPVFNTRPHIEFVYLSNPSDQFLVDKTVTTFPTRTFIWDATDADGNETIVDIEYALINSSVQDTTIPDTLQWHQLSGDADRVTLTELTSGKHTFFVRAIDIAGAISDTLMFPDPGSDTDPQYWEVKQPVGDICLVNDYSGGGFNTNVEKMYTTWLDSIAGPNNYSVWRIDPGSQNTSPQYQLPYAPEDIQATLSYFDKIVWYQEAGHNHYVDADLAVLRYLSNGGSLFLTAQDIDTSAVFIRVDSLYKVTPQGILNIGEEVVSTVDSAKYTMTTNKFIAYRDLKAFVVNRASQTVQFHFNQQGNNLGQWVGNPTMGYLDTFENNGKLLLLSLPLHKLNGRNNVVDVLDYYLQTEF